MICEEWDLSIDLKSPNQSATELQKLFSLQSVKATTNLTVGPSIVEVWGQRNKSNLMIMISFNTDTNQSHSYNFTRKVNAANWINLRISQISGGQEVKVDYKLVYRQTKSVSKTWTNVNLVTENTTTFIQYRKLKINTCKTKGKTIKYKLRS